MRWSQEEYETLDRLYPEGGSRAVQRSLPHRSKRTINVIANRRGVVKVGAPKKFRDADVVAALAASGGIIKAWRVWPRQRRGALMLYGHSHGRLPGNQQSMDIGVDTMGWSPVRLNAIKSVMAQLPPLIEPEGGDDIENDDGGGMKP
ncbi:MAG TPA: hypothetical protein VK512_14035 [Xanthobacteraceae bacterium]|nr:hypothetical protein [Xanthobacteraceae bacterium]